MGKDIETQLINNEVTLQKDLFPKLRYHYKDLRKKNANEFMLKNVNYCRAG